MVSHHAVLCSLATTTHLSRVSHPHPTPSPLPPLKAAAPPATPSALPRHVTTVFATNPAKRHEIVCGSALLAEIPQRLAALLPSRGKTVIVTDENVRALHGDTLLAAFEREGSCTPLIKVRHVRRRTGLSAFAQRRISPQRVSPRLPLLTIAAPFFIHVVRFLHAGHSRWRGIKVPRNES